ncbi:MAG: DUF167 domain-containing protein [Nanoarchaeota archaeon]
MIIHVKVKPNFSKREVESFGNNRYLVYLKSPPENDKANMELINILSKELGVPPKSIHINFGKTSNEKMIEIRD